MLSELSMLLCATLAAGVLLGTLLSALCLFGQKTDASKFSIPDKLKSGLPEPGAPYKINKSAAPESVWISKAGSQYHLTPECGSLRLSGMQRRGVVEYKVCGHCRKANCHEETHAD